MRKIALVFCIIVITYCSSLFAPSTQAQETDAQKLLLDSIMNHDVSGVRTALYKGANPNGVFDTGCSPIYQLASFILPWRAKEGEEGDVKILEVLFEKGAKLQPNERDILIKPIKNGWAHFTEVLLKNGASPTREIVVGKMTPMEIAVRYGQTNIIELLKKHGAPVLEPKEAAQQALIGAAQQYDIPKIEEAIRNGADVNRHSRQGETALIQILSSGVPNLNKYNVVLYLFTKGADPNIAGHETYSLNTRTTTALHVAIRNQSRISLTSNIKEKEALETQAGLIVEALLKNGAYVSARDSDGKTPLHLASQWNNIVGAKMLIEAGSKIMPKDDKGKTPLDYAESGEMIKLLKDHGAKEE